MKLQKILIGLGSVFLLTVFSGCPDRSYMRPEPDWTKQADDSRNEDDGVGDPPEDNDENQ